MNVGVLVSFQDGVQYDNVETLLSSGSGYIWDVIGLASVKLVEVNDCILSRDIILIYGCG